MTRQFLRDCLVMIGAEPRRHTATVARDARPEATNARRDATTDLFSRARRIHRTRAIDRPSRETTEAVNVVIEGKPAAVCDRSRNVER